MYHLLLCSKEFYILLTGCIQRFRKILNINSNYFMNSTRDMSFYGGAALSDKQQLNF